MTRQGASIAAPNAPGRFILDRLALFRFWLFYVIHTYSDPDLVYDNVRHVLRRKYS